MPQDLSTEGRKEVRDILEMYSALKRAYVALPEKAGVKKELLEFPGFDGNHEGAQWRYSRALIEQEAKYANLKPGHDNFNSHWPMRPMYRRMLAEWLRSPKRDQLEKDDIIRIMEAFAQ